VESRARLAEAPNNRHEHACEWFTGIAVEIREPKGIGRCRMTLPAYGSSASLPPFVTGHVEPGATVITDAWVGYHGLAGLGYAHQRRSQRSARARGDDPGELLPLIRARPQEA
jgi:ISXO2-like transposase domain